MKLIGVLTAIMVLVGGCALQPDLSDKSSQTGQLTGQAVDDPPRATLDELFAQVANKVPGFGGLFLDEQGNINVYLKDTSQASKARAAITAVFDPYRPQLMANMRNEGLETVKGQYGFRDLYEWKSQARRIFALFPKDAISLDIDEKINRLTIGVKRLETSDRIEQEIANLGIPLPAVRIEETEAPRFASHTIRDKFRPIKGGIYLEGCTMGFIAERFGVPGFVTNSHCTDIQGGVENTDFYQPAMNWYGGNHIGVETVDPTYSTGGNCPSSFRCRESDSAFAERDSNINSNLGRVARTTAINSINVNHSNPEFRITDEERTPVQGEIVNKIGQRTGWTQGPIVDTCSGVNPQGTNIYLLCEFSVDAGSDNGDSGSPVFKITDEPASGDIYLYGILWGGNGKFWFSEIDGIESELNTLLTCAPGFVC